MANLNLSEFGEKLFVADADHTFIWDTANAISKRVSRNSWLNSGTLTSDAPVTISQTWNAGAVAFTAFKVNAAGTSDANSASGSLLLDLQLNGASQVSVKKSGQTVISSLGSASAPSFIIGTNAGFYQPTNTQISASANNTEVIRFTAIGIRFGSNELGFGASFSSNDTILLRDGAANTLALRNGAAAQTFNVYGTYTSGTSYERLTLSAPSAANAIIGTNKGSGGGTARGLDLHTDGTARWTISTAGHFLAATDNTYDIGASSANRPRNVFTSAAITIGSGFALNFDTRVALFPAGSGILRVSDTSFAAGFRLNGTTADYCKVQKFDGTGFGAIQGKLTTDTAYTGTIVAATGYITIYDSTGTAYRVPCAV